MTIFPRREIISRRFFQGERKFLSIFPRREIIFDDISEGKIIFDDLS